MKHLILALIFIILYSCSDKNSKKNKNLVTIDKIPNYDTLKYNVKLTPDALECMWIFENRKTLDTLSFEKAVVRVTSDTFLRTYEYNRLWACSVPSFLMIPGDTILISGYVYHIYSVEGGRGYPTLIKQIVYSKNID